MSDNSKRCTFGKYSFFYTENSILSVPDDTHFLYGSKKLTIKAFQFLPVKKINEDVQLWKDRRGRTILSFYEDIPTFDFYDREYDSYRYFFLVPHDGYLTGFLVGGGYKLARPHVYEHLRFADEYTRQAMNELGFFDDAPKGEYTLPNY